MNSLGNPEGSSSPSGGEPPQRADAPPDNMLWWNPATGMRCVGGRTYTEEEWKQWEADAAHVMYGGQSPPPCTCAAFREALDRKPFDPTIQEFNGHWAFGTLSLPAMKFCPWCGHPVSKP